MYKFFNLVRVTPKGQRESALIRGVSSFQGLAILSLEELLLGERKAFLIIIIISGISLERGSTSDS